MGQVLVRNLDDRVIATFKARAAASGRSLEAELREALTRAAEAPPDRAALLEEVRRIREAIGPMPPDWPGAVAVIREDRDNDEPYR